MLEKFFNTAGPIKPRMHYHIPMLERVDWEEIRMLIDSEKYFVLHAPRQTGKTSAMLTMMERLNEEGRYAALYANIEAAQAARGDVAVGIRTVCGAIATRLTIHLGDDRLETWLKGERESEPGEMLFRMLNRWSAIAKKPTVLFLDEVDALVGDTLISLLRQIRTGYDLRPASFPQSIVLCGVRDIRDYRIHTGHNEIITGGSAFNIKAKSLTMGNFSPEEIRALFLQHTEATGQVFDEGIFPELWEDTRGQPWLVNALGHEMVWEDRELRDRSAPIVPERYRAARERLIRSRATHLDQLTDKLKEERVRGIIAAILSGESTEENFPEDDLQYVEDLGLIHRRPLTIANRIYRETIPREITSPIQDVLLYEQPWYLTEERRLDMPKLLAAFQQFFREHSDAWLEKFDYKEAGPQLLMQAFLQRIINGGGRINREYALGRKRTDLYIEWPVDEKRGFYGPVQRIVIELKILRKGLESTIAEGVEQTKGYAGQVGAEEAHLVIFDRNPEKSWEEKVWTMTKENLGIWGC